MSIIVIRAPGWPKLELKPLACPGGQGIASGLVVFPSGHIVAFSFSCVTLTLSLEAKDMLTKPLKKGKGSEDRMQKSVKSFSKYGKSKYGWCSIERLRSAKLIT
jgi:hypothetical protein